MAGLVLGRLLGDRTKRLLADEREWLTRLQRVLAQLESDSADQVALDRSIAQLDRLFLLVVIGEFNAGKSAFINALAGAPVLEEGPTPTTTRLQILRYGEAAGRQVEQESMDVVTAPVPLLRDLDIVDTPGTNAIFREHERLTSQFVPQADLVLFVTSADRPFTESERGFLEAIRNWGKKIVFVINKIDVLEREEDREQVRRFVRDQAQKLLGAPPQLFSISARHALRARLGRAEAAGAAPPHHGGSPDPPAHAREARGTDEGADAPRDGASVAPDMQGRTPATTPSGDEFDALERYITTTLDEQERLRLKLLNPLGVGIQLARTTRTTVGGRLELLRQDLVTVDDIDRQLDVYRADLGREFEFRLSEVDNILHQFENRGVAFFDDTLRIGRIPDLLNRARIQREFERTVVADVPQEIDKQVQDVIDWMVASELRQWQAVTAHVKRRQTAHEGRITGGDTSQFTYDRAHLMDTVGRTAQRAVQTYDKEREASEMADGVRNAVAGAALAQAGAVSVGALVTMLATTTAADVTGIIAAGTLAVLGMFVIPSKRARAKRDLRERIAEMRHQLMSGLRLQFDKEVDRSTRGVLDAVAPYTRFVRAEHEKLVGVDRELDAVAAALGRIKSELERPAA